jgi:hypothetical protein
MTEAGWAPRKPERAQADDLGFDQRLMTAERLLRLAGRHPMRFSDPGPANLYLDCGLCGKAVEVLTDRRGGAYAITAGQLLANVLRHLVLRHDLPLSAAPGKDDHGD